MIASQFSTSYLSLRTEIDNNNYKCLFCSSLTHYLYKRTNSRKIETCNFKQRLKQTPSNMSPKPLSLTCLFKAIPILMLVAMRQS